MGRCQREIKISIGTNKESYFKAVSNNEVPLYILLYYVKYTLVLGCICTRYMENTF